MAGRTSKYSKLTYTKIANYYRLSYCGLIIGFIAYCLSLTPSLLPRPVLYEGLIAGVSFVLGYSLGVVISKLIRWIGFPEPSAEYKHAAWLILLIIIPIAAIIYGFKAADWQNEVHQLVGESGLAGRHIATLFLVSFLTASFLLLIGRTINLMIRFTNKGTSRVLPRRLSYVASLVIVGLVLAGLYNGVLEKVFVDVSNNIYRNTNAGTDPGVTQPASSLRSGSNESLVPWDTIGRQGRSFVAGGPSAEDITNFDGDQGQDTIRVYAGLDSADSAKSRADLAVRELERTGAFDRKILVVMTATGTGWIEPQSADSLEYMHQGNSALVAIQYSYLPSWISFLVDKENATEAGKELFDAVYAKWSQLPEGDRPQLIAYGLSLGSFGGQSAFSGVSDLQNRTDGALFMGTPNDTQPWRYFINNRDAGSKEILPVYDGGTALRFAAENQQITDTTDNWKAPRILYMQHASDPVVWWSPDLILSKPDWLKESRGVDVSSSMQWYPFITFLQVTVDQFFGTTVPNGHGHNYGNTIVTAWEAVTTPEDWDKAKADKLQALIGSYSND